MFDGSLPEIARLASLSDAEVVDGAAEWARAENAACARKLAFMAELFARRTGLPAGERELWWIDPQAAVTAEIGAAVNVSPAMALHQTHRGVALRDRLPRVAALFTAGLISEVLVRAIVTRTYLIIDPDVMAAVDAALAERVTRWGPLSVRKTEDAIDALVEEHDPGALRRTRETASTESVQFGSPGDVAGMTSMWARLNAARAALIEARLDEMARSVCDGDPRTLEQRRVEALEAIAAGAALACTCGQPDCTRGTGQRPTKNTVVYVVVDEEALDASEPPAERAADPAPQPAAEPAAEKLPAQCRPAPPAYVFGGGVLPPALLSAILGRAQLREVRHPGETAPEPRYTPSRQTCEFVRCRDLTCRFPGCDQPAQVCDIDHTVPYPLGPTHPSNLKCLCRFHHMLKTFWNGRAGWQDRQLPDGTVIWTSPTGHTYTTHPGAQHLYPRLCQPTADLWSGEPPIVQPDDQRGLMMPRRRQTRAEYTNKTVATERRLNDDLVVERNKPPPF
ncbi:HNH endonuclease signature motif containing protein [Mycobacterium sp. 1274761.0]|uniref:HNH endonuclease signature motif containing protein n=1 Tax=Mycobacterium sp. 1274761.0 TaxID=1834077 RepID=UPI0008002649|nr:HNH endonuclease signature motif containing protein [Mycobacterium sp. 1274761.0]OBK79043.1 hypothetical protein A5651_24615 [Mycobacterium sp. 1274761.0]